MTSTISVSYGLPREVLKWIQSLDLAYSVKSPKRAFANGFLVAEIFSRYDRSIQMHSFDNGASSRVRKDNWLQLKKHFARHDIPCDHDLIQRIMFGGDENDVIEFVKSMYTILTRRRVAEAPQLTTVAQVPPFAKATASHKLRKTEERSLAMGRLDESQNQEELQRTLQDHNKEGREQRPSYGTTNDGGRYNIGIESKVSMTKQERVIQGQTHQMGAERKSEAVKVKQVKVKRYAGDIASLRARLAMGAQDIAPDSSAAAGQALSELNKMASLGGESEVDMAASVMVPNVPPVSEVVGDAIIRTHADPQLFGNDAAGGFLSSLRMKQGLVSNENAALVMEEIGSDIVADKLATAALTRPREFIRAVHWLGGVLSALDAENADGKFREAFAKASAAYISFARTLTNKDEEQTRALFEDLAMPKLVISLGAGSRASPARRAALIAVLSHVFVNDTGSLIALIKQLQESIDNQGAFLRVLGCFAQRGGAQSPDLLDLYVYYASIGLNMAQPSARVVSLSILDAISRTPSGAEVLGGKYNQLLGQLRSLAESGDEPWEVQAGLLSVASRLIAPAESGSGDEIGSVAQQMLSVIGATFSSKQSRKVRLVGLVSLAPILRAHPTLLGPYMECMCSLDPRDSDTASVLGFAEEPTKLGPYPLHAAPVAWMRTGAGSLVAAQIAATVTALENIEAIHLQVLLAVFGALGGGEASDRWTESMMQLKNFVFLALSDPGCTSLAAAVLRKMVSVLPSEEAGNMFINDKGLIGVLMLMYPRNEDGNKECHMCAERLFRELAAEGQGRLNAVRSMLSTLREQQPESIANFPSLRTLLEELEGMP